MRPVLVLSASAALLSLTACGEKKAPKTVPVTTTQTKGAPAWIDQEEIPDGLAAVGIAQPNPFADKAMQRRDALAQARANLAAKVKTRVQNVFAQLDQRVTAGGSQGKKTVKTDALQRVQENVTRQMVDQELVGSVPREFWTDPADGNLYVLVVMKREAVEQALEAHAQAQLRREIDKGEKDLQLALDNLDAAIAASAP